LWSQVNRQQKEQTVGRHIDIAIVFAGMHGFGMLKQGGVMWEVMCAGQRLETSC
jgi:hypothetical protein